MMTKKNFPRFLGTVCSMLLIQSMTTPLWVQPSQAQSQAPKRSKITFQPPKGQPSPKVTFGGGTRDGKLDSDLCPQSSPITARTQEAGNAVKAMVPLLPKTRLGLTTASHPTFMVYVPKTTAKELEFKLEDQDANEIYQTTVKLKSSPSIVSVALPKSSRGLEMGKDYKWVMGVVCQSSDAEAPFIEGAVRRFEPSGQLKAQLNRAKPFEQAMLYGQSGVWIDAITNLATLKRTQPNNSEAATAWRDILNSVGLNAIANAPIQN